MFAISADGRAQAKATVLPADQQRLNVNGNASSGYDSFGESDSSLDGDSPRGMAPDGGAYLAYRRRHTFSGGSFCSTENVNHSFRSIGESVHHSFGSSSSAPIFKTPKKPRPPQGTFPSVRGGRPPSSRLPTPLKSSPPTSLASMIPRSSKQQQQQQLLRFEDAEEDESEAETVVDDPILLERELPPPDEDADGDALTALKKAVARRRGASAPMRRPTIKTRPFIRARNQSNPFSTTAPKYQNQNHPPPPFPRTPKRKWGERNVADGGYHYKENVGNTSPTTVTDPDCDSDRYETEIEGGETRCVCGRKDDRGTMVECESCKNWLHVRCVGYGPKTLPKVYVCPYCDPSTPQGRRMRM